MKLSWQYKLTLLVAWNSIPSHHHIRGDLHIRLLWVTFQNSLCESVDEVWDIGAAASDSYHRIASSPKMRSLLPIWAWTHFLSVSIEVILQFMTPSWRFGSNISRVPVSAQTKDQSQFRRWWTEWQWDMFFSEYFYCLLPVSLYQGSIFIFNSPMTDTYIILVLDEIGT
jgi:hypothetical protein